jgi:hypothetical protein
MTKHTPLLEGIDPPTRLALVFVCEKCGNRIADSGKNPSHRLASRLKKAAKRRCEKGDMRSVLTSCMDVCPDDRIAISIAPSDGRERAAFYTVRSDDLDASADAIVSAVLALRR